MPSSEHFSARKLFGARGELRGKNRGLFGLAARARVCKGVAPHGPQSREVGFSVRVTHESSNYTFLSPAASEFSSEAPSVRDL